MAFGFSPKHTESLPLGDLSPAQFLVMAVDSAKQQGWKLSYISDTGFIAFTDNGFMKWNGEITVKIEGEAALLKSESTGNEMMDWGRNKKTIAGFVATFNERKLAGTPEELEAKYAILKADMAPPESDILKLPPPTAKQQITGVLSLFQPRAGYFITPLLININIVIFIIMVANGVSVMSPGTEDLLKWGANFRPLTLEGEWWRLLTNCFLHIGILHLLLNMYALVYIGLLLEPYLGRARFLAAYLLTGIAASVASLWWHDLTVSAGASGAIFGMYGVFLAMLTTNLIEKTARKSLLASIGVFIVYNLTYGMKGGVDNAAHIGGLLSGLVVGYAFIPGLKRPDAPGLKWAAIGILALLISGGTFAAYRAIPNDIGLYETKMKQFSELETKALAVFNLPKGTSNDSVLFYLNTQGINYWQQDKEIVAEAQKLKLPDMYVERNKKLIEYCDLRVKSYELIRKSILENTNEYDADIQQVNGELETVVGELGGGEKKK